MNQVLRQHALFLVFFAWTPINVFAKCTPQTSWLHIQEWITHNLQTDQLSTPPWKTLCLPDPPFPKGFGIQIRKYLWMVEQYRHIARVFKRNLSAEQESTARQFKTLCVNRFPTQCGRPLKHRLNLLDQYPSPPIQW